MCRRSLHQCISPSLLCMSSICSRSLSTPTSSAPLPPLSPLPSHLLPHISSTLTSLIYSLPTTVRRSLTDSGQGTALRSLSGLLHLTQPHTDLILSDYNLLSNLITALIQITDLTPRNSIQVQPMIMTSSVCLTFEGVTDEVRQVLRVLARCKGVTSLLAPQLVRSIHPGTLTPQAAWLLNHLILYLSHQHHGDRQDGDVERGNSDVGRGSGDVGRGNGDVGKGSGDVERGSGVVGRGNGDVGKGNGDVEKGSGDVERGSGVVLGRDDEVMGTDGDEERGYGDVVREDDDEVISLGQSVLDTYVEILLELWASKRNKDKVLTCLLIEGVSCCCTVVGEGVNPQLSNLLYPLLQAMGSGRWEDEMEYGQIEHAATLTIANIARVCHYPSLTHLITDNIQPITSSITLCLSYGLSCDEGRGALDALEVLLHLMIRERCEVLQGVCDVISRLLPSLHLHKHLHTSAITSLLHILLLYTQLVSSLVIMQGSSNEVKSRIQDEDVVEYFRKCSEERLAEEDKLNEDLNDNVSPLLTSSFPPPNSPSPPPDSPSPNSPSPPPDSSPPPSVSSVVDILTHCQHLLPSAPTYPILHQQHLLGIVNVGLTILQPYSNLLLPLVAQIWDPLLVCIESAHTPTSTALLQQAMSTLRVLVECAGDFIKARALKRALPRMLQLLRLPTHDIHPSSLKLAHTTLSVLAPLCEVSGVSGYHLLQAVGACLPYLDGGYGVAFHEEATRCLTHLYKLDPSGVWLCLADIGRSNRHTLTPPTSNLPTVTLMGSGEPEEHDLFHSTIQSILKE